MNAQELLTAPASTLTRKQRKDRAALKRQLAATMQLPAGYMVGRVRTPDRLPGAEVVIDDTPAPIRRAFELGQLDPRGGSVMVRMLDGEP